MKYFLGITLLLNLSGVVNANEDILQGERKLNDNGSMTLIRPSIGGVRLSSTSNPLAICRLAGYGTDLIAIPENIYAGDFDGAEVNAIKVDKKGKIGKHFVSISQTIDENYMCNHALNPSTDECEPNYVFTTGSLSVFKTIICQK